MFHYILKRLLLIVPTLIGIMLINFAVIQAAPGGPIEQTLAKLQGVDMEATARVILRVTKVSPRIGLS